MDYYVSKKAGSLLFRKPNKLHLVAGDHIPADYWNALPGEAQQSMLAEGTVEGFDDPDSVELAPAPAVVQPIKIGVGKDQFMPEAKVQPGTRHDAALDKLIAEQERARELLQQSKIDARKARSGDGVVEVELPIDDDDEDDFDDDLTDAEREAIRRFDAGED
jgi:hypothetical protein